MTLFPLRQTRALWDRYSELERAYTEMSRLFGNPASRDYGLLEGVWSPAIDVLESPETVIVRTDLPGMSRENIDVTVTGDTLSIKGTKNISPAPEGSAMIRSERFSGSFNRTVTLPYEVDAAKVTASYRNGTLELTLPKREEHKPRQIAISVK